MFRITSFDDIFNGVVPQHYDDFRIQQQLLLSREFAQCFPETIHGGRQVLWWCPSCSSPWWQADTGLLVLHLTTEQLVKIGHRLYARVLHDGTILELPMQMCPACLGAVLTLGAYPGHFGCQVLWRPLPPSPEGAPPFSSTLTAGPGNVADSATPPQLHTAPDSNTSTTLFAMVEQGPQYVSLSLADMGEAMLTWLTDLPGELDSLSAQLGWIARVLPPPRHEECSALTVPHLSRLAQLAEPDQGMQWKGVLWQPPTRGITSLLTPHPLVILFAILLPEDEPTSVFSLYALWQRLIPRVFEAAQWDEHL